MPIVLRTFAAVLATLLAAGVLAGCTEPAGLQAGGGTAFDAYRATRGLAKEWASDSVLVIVSGIEAKPSSGAQEPTTDPANPPVQGPPGAADERLGDGVTPVWAVAYWSQAVGKVSFYTVERGEVQRTDLMSPQAIGLQRSFYPGGEEAWRIDSPDVAKAAFTGNATLGAWAEAGTLASVVYSLDPATGTWTVLAQGPGGSPLLAMVSMRSGELMDVGVPGERIGGAAAPRVVPPPIHETGDVQASADAFAPLGLPPCEAPTSTCFEYTFEAVDRVTVEASLTWTQAANDFDLYLFAGDQQAEVSGGASPDTDEHIEARIAPGSYRFVVVAYAVANDSFTFDATFS